MKIDVDWDRGAFPYLVAAHWSAHGQPLITVQSRDQRTQLVLAVDPQNGRTTELHRDTDPHWLEIKTGWPAWTPNGELVRIATERGYRYLQVDASAMSAPILDQLGLRDEYRDTDSPHRPHIIGSLLGDLNEAPEDSSLAAAGAITYAAVILALADLLEAR